MDDSQILIKYDGGDASKHVIDGKLYGQSLQGIDRMVSDCLLIVSHERLPKRNERCPVILKVKEAEEGSFSSPAFYQEMSEMLGVGFPILAAIGPEIISHYVGAVIAKFTGDDDAMELAITKMAEMHAKSIDGMAESQKGALEFADRIDERRHIERMDMQDLLRTAILASSNAAVDYVAPVGRSVDTSSFTSGGLNPVKVNKEQADQIRESQKLEWEPIGKIILRTDGYRFHTNGLSVENPDSDGFMMAEVIDPLFEEESNDYTVASQRKAKIEVLARKGYKFGKLSKIQIINFENIVA